MFQFIDFDGCVQYHGVYMMTTVEVKWTYMCSVAYKCVQENMLVMSNACTPVALVTLFIAVSSDEVIYVDIVV